jgi:hypothetical protein
VGPNVRTSGPRGTAAQGPQFGKERVEKSQLGEESQAALGRCGLEEAIELFAHPFHGCARQRATDGAGLLEQRSSYREAWELCREAGETEGPQRVLAKHACTRGPQTTGPKIGQATQRIAQAARGEIESDGVDGKLPTPEIPLETPTTRVHDVDLTFSDSETPGRDATLAEAKASRAQAGPQPGNDLRDPPNAHEIQVPRAAGEGGVSNIASHQEQNGSGLRGDRGQLAE